MIGHTQVMSAQYPRFYAHDDASLEAAERAAREAGGGTVVIAPEGVFTRRLALVDNVTYVAGEHQATSCVGGRRRRRWLRVAAAVGLLAWAAAVVLLVWWIPAAW